jgi:hypothetical protein
MLLRTLLAYCLYARVVSRVREGVRERRRGKG